MKKEKSCGAIVSRTTETGREILLIRHVNGGHWAFPKGHVERMRPRNRPLSVKFWKRPVSPSHSTRASVQSSPIPRSRAS